MILSTVSGVCALLEVAEEKAGKVGVETLVARDELVGEGETGHEAALLEPEDGSKRAGEEDALDGGKGDEALGESGATVADPAERPVGLLLDDGDGLDGVKEELALFGLADVGVDEERVSLGVDVLHHDLEAIEAAGLCGLDFGAEALDEVLVDDAIRSGEEGEDVRDKVALVVVELVVPVVEVLGEVDLLGGPEGSLGLLVHLPDLLNASRRVMAAPEGEDVSGCACTRTKRREGLDEKGLLLFGEVNLTDKLAVDIFGLGGLVSRVGDGVGLGCEVELLALGEEARVGEVVVGSVVEVELGGGLLGRRGVDVDAGEASGDLLRRRLEVVLCHGRHGGGRVCGTVSRETVMWMAAAARMGAVAVVAKVATRGRWGRQGERAELDSAWLRDARRAREDDGRTQERVVLVHTTGQRVGGLGRASDPGGGSADARQRRQAWTGEINGRVSLRHGRAAKFDGREPGSCWLVCTRVCQNVGASWARASRLMRSLAASCSGRKAPRAAIRIGARDCQQRVSTVP
ncbi:hypothetical protein L1887_49710 [Cichorium endivia]|nr:hypothetical protein L1887_49710 [Cichorium endivia]